MKTASLITLTLIAGAILVVAGTSIEMAFAQANLAAPGQTKLLPSLGFPPPGSVSSSTSGGGNSGQCIKAGFPKGKVLGMDCMPK